MKIIFLFLALSILSSCSYFRNSDDENKIASPEALYNQGMESLEKKLYEDAIETFESLEKNYPYSKWAVKAQIMSAFSSYKDEEYNTALVTLDRFIDLHPGNEDAEYAYYLRALSFYEQISNITKDQSYTQYAKSSLEELIARYPNGKYARDARIKLDLVYDHLAGKELEVGRFYLKNGRYTGAINRFKLVVTKYDTTTHVKEALYRLVEAYLRLGITEEAKKYAAVLGHNYPQSDWYKKAYVLLEGKEPEIAKDGKVSQPKWHEKLKFWK